MFTVRNDWPLQSIRFSEARAKSGGKVGYAVTGSTWDPMRMHDQGATVRAHRRRIAIVTTWTREGETKHGISIKRYRLHRLGEVKKLRKGQSISLGQGHRRKKRKWGQPFITKMRKFGIYQRVGNRLFMVRDLSVKGYTLKRRPWHSAAVKQFAKRSLMEQVFIREAQKQLGMIR